MESACRQPPPVIGTGSGGGGSMRDRANTLEKSEQIRPPVRRKRRSSHDSTGSTSSLDMRGRELRSGSVPPDAALHQPPLASLPESNPTPLPRIRRVTARPMLMLHSATSTSPVSQEWTPSSGHNTPSNRGSLDLSDLTPFGRCDSPKSGESGTATVGRSATSASSSGATPHRNSIRRNKWNWIWGSNKPSSGGGGGGGGSSSKESKDSSDEKPSSEKPSTGSSTSTKQGSFLSRKRKSRHISLPDITISSNDSSRSGSPVVFKVSLTSLFGGNSGGHSSIRKSSGSSFRRRTRSKEKAVTKASPKATQRRPIISQQHVLNDFATEMVDDLRPVQYCQISPGTDPLQG